MRVIEDILRRHRFEPDLLAVRSFLAAIAAHRLAGPPVWPMIVAPPGAGKTELIEGLKNLAGVHFIDSLTPQTFISGYFEEDQGGRRRNVGEPSAGLLHRIGTNGIIIFPDFSTVLGMKYETKAQILSQLRRIFDGGLSKEFGTPGEATARKWNGRITCAVAVTPEIDRNYSVFQSLGERFVMIRWPRAGGIEAALSAMNQKASARVELTDAVQALFGSLPNLDPAIRGEIQDGIAGLSEVVVRARTHIHRGGFKKEIVYVPEAESSTRLAQQLAQLAKGSALINGREVVNETDMAVVRRVGLDCIPPVRRRVLENLATGDNCLEALPKSTLSYAREDLQAHGLLGEDLRLSKLACECLKQAGFSSTPYDPPVEKAA